MPLCKESLPYIGSAHHCRPNEILLAGTKSKSTTEVCARTPLSLPGRGSAPSQSLSTRALVRLLRTSLSTTPAKWRKVRFALKVSVVVSATALACSAAAPARIQHVNYFTLSNLQPCTIKRHKEPTSYTGLLAICRTCKPKGCFHK